MKYLKTINELFEAREIRDASLFTPDEVIDIENMLLEYVDKWEMKEVAYEYDEDDNANYPIFNVNGADFQYHIGRYRNVAIDICYREINKGKAEEIKKDLENNFIPRLKRFGYDIIHFDEDSGDWKDNGDTFIDDKMEISIVITKRDW
jgi:hypothetical protein